jgi:hypothetical protein
MTDQEGVQEVVAEPQAEQEAPEQDSQQINWQRANETMAQQKKRLDELEQQNRMFQQQQMLYQQQAQAAKQSTASPLDSIADDDIVTGAEFKGTMSKLLQAEKQQFESALQQQQRELKTLSMRAQYSDYDKVVANTLKKAENDPALAQAIASSSDPHRLAYEIGRASMPAQQQVNDAKRIVENAQKPGSVSQAATGGSALAKVDYFMNMSDADFERHIASVKRGA